MRASVLLVLGALCAISSVNAHKRYMDNIPNGHKVVDGKGRSWPGVGHVRRSGHGKHNQFGEDFKHEGKSWTTALCNMDSDGDGISNGVELGDPQCKWEEGDTPQFVTNITHPGVSTETEATHPSGVTGAPLWVEWHGFMMTIAWVLIIPLSICFPVLFKHRSDNSINWFRYHRTLAGIGLGIVFIAVIVAIANTPSDHFATSHGRLGLATVTIAFIQAVSGVWRPQKYEVNQSRLRLIWEPLHWWTGRVVVLLAAAAIYTGYVDHLSVYTSSGKGLSIVMLVITGLWSLAYVLYKYLLAPSQKSKVEEMYVQDEAGEREMVEMILA